MCASRELMHTSIEELKYIDESRLTMRVGVCLLKLYM